MSNRPPPPQDASSQSRNEYIPAFISQRPFWSKIEGQDESTADADYLEHQRLQAAPKDTLDKAKWYDRGRKAGPAATKFRKGACENCGAMTHKTKECLSRPRKQGAKWSGRDIQADEVIDEVKLGWDAKRDRWNGYDAQEYSAVVKEYEELEALKRAAAGNADGQKTLENGEGTPTADSDARYGEETDMGRSQPTSTRQLRLREDTAKYLLNLDLDSAKYDPKTRSMDTTQAITNDSTADDGFVRPASSEDDAAAFERAQRYAWETQESSNATSSLTTEQKLHLQANPTEGLLLLKKAETESRDCKAAARKALLDKYGDQGTHVPSAAEKQRNQIPVSTERYVEYDAQGRIKNHADQNTHPIARSKYAEDVHSNNHGSVWGSWWRNFEWGYACCHSTVKNSYCTGEAGKKAFEDAEGMRTGQALLMQAEEKGEEEDQPEKKLGSEQEGEDMAAAERNDAKNNVINGGAKKRTLQEIQSGISEEEMDNYKRNRRTAEDPMASLLGKDELL